MTLKASEQGLARIKQARKERGWTVDDSRWLIAASQVLEPERSWEEGGPFAVGISDGTWGRFRTGKKPINERAFKAYCQVLGLAWEEIVDRPLPLTQSKIQHRTPKIQPTGEMLPISRTSTAALPNSLH